MFASLRNRARLRLKRLRQPRYAAGAIGGLLYFYFMFFRQQAVWSEWLAGQGVLIGSVVLFLATSLVWMLPAPKTALAFTLAEVQFLFTAPLSRRQLLNYKLLGTHVGGFFGAAFFTFMFRPHSIAEAAMFFIGIWLVMDTWTMHVLGLSLARGSLLRHGLSGLARQRIPLFVASAALVAIGATVVPALPRVAAMANAHDVMTELHRVTSAGAGGVVFWPFHALLRVPMAASWPEFFRALPAALLILALNYIWVLRADMAFEEASAAQAQKIAELQRTGVFQPKIRKTASTPFTLATTGRPEVAIVWKNLIRAGRYASLRVLSIVLPMFVVSALAIVIVLRGEAIVLVAQLLCGIALFVVLMMGPQFTRNDLRSDLPRLAVLKTWPIRGSAIVRGEVLAPACLLSAFAWLFIAAGAILADLPLAERVSYTVAALVLAPGIIMTGVILQNGFALMFPAWVDPRGVRVPGIDGMGHQMILLYGGMLALIVLLLPPVLVASVVWFGVSYVTHAQPILAPSAAGAVALVAECWLITQALGHMFDRMDVSAIGIEERFE